MIIIYDLEVSGRHLEAPGRHLGLPGGTLGDSPGLSWAPWWLPGAPEAWEASWKQNDAKPSCFSVVNKKNYHFV